MRSPDAEQRRGCGPDADQKLTGEESNAQPEYPDRVSLGAHVDANMPPVLGAATLWRVALRASDGDIAAALGSLLVRLSRLEREVGR